MTAKTKKPKTITYHVVDEVLLGGTFGDIVNLAFVPVGPESIRGKNIGLGFKVASLRRFALDALWFCDQLDPDGAQSYVRELLKPQEINVDSLLDLDGEDA